MSRGTATVIVIVVSMIAVFGNHLLGALGLLILAGAYLLSLRINPRTRHTGWRSCNGTGEYKGAVFGWAHRNCPRCDRGRLVRWGARYAGSERIRREHVVRRQTRRVARQERTWR